MEQKIYALLLLSGLLTILFHGVTSTSLADEPATEVFDVPTGDMDQIISNAANSSKEFSFFYDDNQGFVKVQLDMLYTYEEYAEIEKSNKEGGIAKRTTGLIAGRGGARRWTNNIVNYQFAPGTFTARDQTQMNAAIADWEKYTCLDFQQSSSGNRIYFQNGGGCFSRVGMVGGPQTLGLAPGCRVKGVVIHEIGHALGLHHEQTRPDRDSYVRILEDNITPKVLYNFEKNSWRTIMNLGMPYDYSSIMHYGKRAFTANGRITIQTLDAQYQDVIGNRHALSFGDIKTVNIMYNCKEHTTGCTKKDSDCPGEGFVGKDCTCWCRGESLSNPTKSCPSTATEAPVTDNPTEEPVTGKPVTDETTEEPVTEEPEEKTTQPPTDCQDRHSSCSYWASRNECRLNPDYMLVYCKRSCNRCGESSCKDQVYGCANLKRQGFCTGTWASLLSSVCRATCGYCVSQQADAVCADENQHCADWARKGECTSNPGYMLESCKKSCNRCDANKAMDANNGKSNPECQDKKKECSYWARIGECVKNPRYMYSMCRQSCELCDAA